MSHRTSPRQFNVVKGASFKVRLATVCIVILMPVELSSANSKISDLSDAASHGTLIAVAPTRDGIVMAADSRSTLGNQYCDDTYKLVEVSHRNPTAIAVAGIGIVFTRPPAGTTDLCKWIKTAQRVMDIEKFTKEYIEAHLDAISGAGLLRLGTASLEQVRQLQKFSPDAPRAYAGNNLYTIVIASFDPKTKRSRIGVLGTRFNPITNIPEVTDHAFWEFTPNSKGEAFNFGLFDYVPEHVYREGRAFVQEYLNFKPNQRLVRQISAEEAASALSNLVEAAGKTTKIVPTPDDVGIGGTTDVLLLGAKAKPQRLRWKAR